MTDDILNQSRTLDAMSSRGISAKREYVLDLERRADAESLQKMVECLRDESWFLRDLAELAFGRLGEAGARVLRPLLKQGLWYTRTSAARALGRMGHTDSIPDLLELTQDANETVAVAARDAIVAVGRQRGAVRIAHALHRMPPDVRRRRMEEIVSRDAVLGERLSRLLRTDDLMTVEDVSSLDDDSAAVRASEEGVEWEVLTGPPPPASPGSPRRGGA
jgi:HEAT repeat protein